MDRHHPLRKHARSLLTAAALAAGLLTAQVPAASASLLVQSATGCAPQVLEQPFLRWGDPMHYVLVPDGTLEGGTAWSLSGAARVAGNEIFYVHAPGDRRSLALPAGSRAVTGSMCVGVEHPTLRFFARNTGSPLALLRVAVRFRDSLGLAHTVPIGAVVAGGRWAPTLPLPVIVNLLPLLPGEKTPVQFVFTPVGGEWQIDDVYVDPYRK